MPVGLRFQRKHRRLGYRLKYLYYLVARRDVLQKRVSYGNDNAGQTVYVVKPDYQDGVEGLLSLVFKQVLYIDWAKKQGYIPYVDWKHFKTQYHDGIHNAWEYFFRQPSALTEEQVYRSRRVYLSGWTWKNIDPQGLFEAEIFHDAALEAESHRVLTENLQFTDEVLQRVEEEAQRLEIERCIGVYVRGTDYVKLRPSGEYVQPTVEQVKERLTAFIERYQAPVFLVTEDGGIYDALSETFGDRIRTVSFDTFIRNYDGKDVLSRSHVLTDDRKKRGQDYLIKMLLLARCRYLISSMTQGSKFSYSLNGGRYEDEWIFDLGLYP